MTDIALTNPRPAATAAQRPKRRQGKVFYGYLLTLCAIGAGWWLRDDALLSPEDGVGYWLGIVGGSMMLVLLLYPLRKRFRILRILGGTPHWFRIHMVFGIVGPLLVLFHSNFHLGSLNSRIAMSCMLLVAGSGVIGRHIYARIHRGLYGRKTSLNELRGELTQALDKSHGMAASMPTFVARLKTLAEEVQGDSITGSLGIRKSFLWGVRQYAVQWSLRRAATAELAEAASRSASIQRDLPRLQSSIDGYIRGFIRQTTRLAQFTLYEKLFSLWHVLHLPLFFMMIISALAHVLAVHMY
ncbi:MAG: hypothetical protein KDI09_17715 [Halioglobus sp.]|nr:hypothetical protein [Halioglobus sp.]